MADAVARHNASVGELRRLKVNLGQAARVLDLGTDQIRRAIQRRVVTPTFLLEGERRVRALDGIDLLCLRLRDQLKGPIRDQLYLHLKRAPDDLSLRQAFRVQIDRSQLATSRTTTVRVFDAALDTLCDINALADLHLVDEDHRLRDSGVEAHRIAALLDGGMSVDAILDDYPNLDRTQVEAAARHAAAKPQARRYPARTVKSALREGGAGTLGALLAGGRASAAAEAPGPPRGGTPA